MNKKIVYSLIGLAVVFFITSFIIFIKSISVSRERDITVIKHKAGSDNQDFTTIKVKAFYFVESADIIVKPVEYKLEVSSIREVAIQRFLEILFKGEPGCITPIPPDVKLRSLYFIPKKSMLVLDFAEELVGKFPGGSTAELEFIYFIVDNICYNFKEVQKVKFLVSGNEYQTLSGHIDLENPFYPDYTFLGIDE